MKKKNIINLIKYYTEGKDKEFKNEAIHIARYFDSIGDYSLSSYIMSLLQETNMFVPQENEIDSNYLKKVELTNEPLLLPDEITKDILGIINAVNHNVGINKFLFVGSPGTGKTESVKHLSRLLERELYVVNFNTLIDSKLGQTSKNMEEVFNDINKANNLSNKLILFDEIDAIALDRINSNDLREMGRVTSSILKELDNLNKDVVLVATTNLYENFDKALSRRFDSVIDFNRYTNEDLIKIAENTLNNYLKVFNNLSKDVRIFRKILSIPKILPYPSELNNIIKTSVAFSEPNNPYDYLQRLMNEFNPQFNNLPLNEKYELNFTLRELEILTGISKSQISREVRSQNE